jgi:hypothetical protein
MENGISGVMPKRSPRMRIKIAMSIDMEPMILSNSFIESIVVFKCAEWRKGRGDGKEGVAGNLTFFASPLFSSAARFGIHALVLVIGMGKVWRGVVRNGSWHFVVHSNIASHPSSKPPAHLLYFFAERCSKLEAYS